MRMRAGLWLRSLKRTRQGTHEVPALETADVPLRDMDTPRIPTSVYAEMTPNPAVMKFVADRALAPGNVQLEFRSKNEAALCSPLATELFNFPFVTSVFVSGPMVSVTKDDSLGWEMIVQQLREYIREWLMDHQDAVVEAQIEAALPQLLSLIHI